MKTLWIRSWCQWFITVLLVARPGFPIAGSVARAVWDPPHSGHHRLGPLCTSDINTCCPVIPQPPQLSFLRAPLPKPLPSKPSCCMNYEHQIETSCCPAAFTRFSPNKDFWQSINSPAAQESKNTISGQVKNMFLLRLSFYLLTLDVIPRFSTKPFLCIFATFHAIRALFLNTLSEVLKPVLNLKPSISREGMRLFYHRLSNLQTDPDFWNKKIIYTTLVRWASFPYGIWIVLQKEDIFEPWYYSEPYK